MSLTASTMLSAFIPKSARSSSGFPLRGTPLTARCLMIMFLSILKALATASPMPPEQQFSKQCHTFRCYVSLFVDRAIIAKKNVDGLVSKVIINLTKQLVQPSPLINH